MKKGLTMVKARPVNKTRQQLLQEIEELKTRLSESEDTLEAIRTGAVDALIISDEEGEKIFSLQTSDYSYRVMVENMNEGAVILDEKGIIVFTNKAFSNLAGRRMPSLVGTLFTDFIPGAFHKNFAAFIEKCLFRPHRDEFAISYAKGSTLPVSISGTAYEIPGNKNLCLIINDLTERKAAEELQRMAFDEVERKVVERTAELEKANKALRESEDRFRSVLDNSVDVIYRLNVKTGRYEYISPSAANIMGFSAEELISRDADAALEMVHPDDLPAVRAAHARLEEASPVRVEYRQLTKSGDYRWVSNQLSLIKDGMGRPLFRGGNLRDITERKLNEAMLHRAKKLSDSLNRINETLHSTLDSREVLQRLIAEGVSAFNCNSAALSYRKDDGWIVDLVHGMPLDFIGMRTSDGEEPHALLAYQTGQPVAVSDAFNDERFNREHLRSHNIRSVIVVPLFTRSEPFGVIFFNYSDAVHSFTEPEIDFARQLAATASIALENARLFKDLKNSEDALRESEERFRTIAETVPVLVCITRTADSIVMFTNEYNNKAFGLRGEDIIGTRGPDYYCDPADREKMVDMFRRQGFVDGYGLKVKKSDGSPFWIMTSVRAIVYNGHPAMIGASIDITECKRLEEKLLYQANILQSVADAVIVTDLSFIITSWNKPAERMYGWNADEVMGKPIKDVVRSEMSEERRAAIYKVVQEGGAKFTEIVQWTKDGRAMFVECNSMPMRDSAGVITGYVTVNRDVSKRKRAEEEIQRLLAAVKEEKDRLASVLASISDEVWFADTKKKFTLANSSAVREFGLDPSEAVGVEELAGKLEVYREDGSLRPVNETPPLRALKGEVVRNEEEIIRMPGSGELKHRQVNSNPVRNSAGEIIGSVSVVRDITEHRKAEKALRETKDYLDKLIGYANAPIIVWNPEMRITRFNGGFEKLTGWMEDEMLGEHLSRLFPDESRDASMDKIGRARKGERWEYVEIPILCKDGGVKLALWNSANVNAEDGRTLLATIAQGTDITERKKAEEETKRYVEDLRKSNEELERFNRLMVGRELRMVELKKQVNDLRAQQGEPPMYNAEFKEK